MWVPVALTELFTISKETVDTLREDLAAVRAERDALKTQLVGMNANFSWLTTRVNALEVERAQLIQKAYGITVSVPEIVRHASPSLDMNALGSLFEHIDDEVVKKIDPSTLSN